MVLQSEDLDPAAGAWLREVCDLQVCHFTDRERFEPLLARADALLVRTYTRVDGALLDKAPRLRCVARAGVAVDRIDVAECRRRGIEVVHTPDANSVAVAEYVFAMLFDALRPRLFLDAPIPQDRWNALRRELEATNQLNELTLGVLGLGRIGKRVARIGRGLGMEVLYHDIAPIPEVPEIGARSVDLPTLLRRSDIVTIHVDSRPENRRFFSQACFAPMRETAIVVNTSRGFVMDDHALAAFLRANPRARALIDVHDPEPFTAENPLLRLPNACLSPHLAASTATAHVNMSWVVKDLWRVLKGERPEHPAPLQT